MAAVYGKTAQVLMAAACIALIFNFQSASANPVDDEDLSGGPQIDAFSEHCPALCAKPKTQYKLAECMNDCMCASYCVIFESLSDWPLSVCMPRCRKANPYKSKNFFKKMEKLLY